MQNMALVAQTCAGIEPNYVLVIFGEKCSTFKTFKNHYNLAVQALPKPEQLNYNDF